MQRLEVEFRAADLGSNKVGGHAAVFGQVSPYGKYGAERIAPGAFASVLADPATDVRALINHDPNLLLGRQSSGTLRLEEDRDGLYFDVDLPDTSYARDLKELMSRGDITGASFGFVVGDEHYEKHEGRSVRVIDSFVALLDVSPVTYPAYSATDVDLRSRNVRVQSARAQAARIRWARLKEGR